MLEVEEPQLFPMEEPEVDMRFSVLEEKQEKTWVLIVQIVLQEDMELEVEGVPLLGSEEDTEVALGVSLT